MRLKYFIFIILSFVFLKGYAQENDFGVWTSAEMVKKIGKWNFSGSAEFRTKTNTTKIDRFSIGVEGNYKLLQPLEIGLAYNFIYFNDLEYDDFQPRHRATFYIEGEKKIGNFCFSLKEKIQFTAKDVSDRLKENGKIDNYSINPEYVWRNKFSTLYDIPNFKLNPGVSIETFFSLNNPENNSLDKIRYTLFLKYKFSKHHNVEFFGSYGDEYDTDEPSNKIIVGMSYQYKF
jgi:hypothetical protein